MNDNIKIYANVTIDVIDVVQKKTERVEKHNLVTTLGKNLVRDLLGMASGVTGLNYFAIGTGSTASTIGDTVLDTEVFRDTFTLTTYTSGKLNIQYYLASGSANGSTLTEAGLFGDNATGTVDTGTLFARVVHTGVAKSASLALNYSWDITIG